MAAPRRCVGLLVALVSAGLVAGCRSSVPKLQALTYDPGRVVPDQHGCWYAERIGAFAGVWRYDDATGTARPVVRAEDAGGFRLAEDSLYLSDRFERRVLKVDAATRDVVWQAPVPSECGAFDLLVQRESVIAVGAAGCMAVFDAHGRRRAERTGLGRLWHPQVLTDGRIAVVAPDRWSLDILHHDLTTSEERPLPIQGPRTSTRHGRRFLIGSGYAAGSETLYLATAGGAILRYDLRAHQWLAPYRIEAGIGAIAVDDANGVLLAYNRAHGYVDVRSLEDGRHLQRVPVNTFGNTINVDPARRVAVLASRGRPSRSVPQPGGLHRFRYAAVSP